ncbi:MAG: type I-U CRISPR-associated helicase/endonuclease Cas3 [Deltaproteobacteria bacterium]|nr:MAG: type I-U CRISPR-associated helicase/endonuclease Cas3 [Deltaproteobacteria bacterium]
MMSGDFDQTFAALMGTSPFPWQRALYQWFLAGKVPPACNIPTGLGKTSTIAIWLLARVAGAALPTRLVYVVNRRTVVDQTTVEVQRLRENLRHAGITAPLAVSTLRGQMADNREWSEDPSRMAAICGTVDMILGQDALLIHDEAHLEPAFQTLLECITAEQARSRDRWPLRVMALTATSRDVTTALQLSDEDRAHPVVDQRIHATKRLSLHLYAGGDLVEKMEAQVRLYANSGLAVLVFLRTVDDVGRLVARLMKAAIPTQQLTGTMRGYERDRLVSQNAIFRRFLPSGDLPGESAVAPASGTVVLVCTSAGEVGVNLSADHLVCDLATFDAMAQRFGRVNRFGLRKDTEVHVFHPELAALESDDETDRARGATLALLRDLRGDASPSALEALDPDARRRAFAPPPTIVPATEILFDAWAMTTIRDDLPGRPPVDDYLHGVAAWEPPTTQVAWRREVELLSRDQLERHKPQDLLDDYPLKSHELLSDRTSRIVETLTAIIECTPAASAAPVWVIREHGKIEVFNQQGRVEVTTLGELVQRDRKRSEDRLGGCTLLLPASASHPINGLLTPKSWSGGHGDDGDVADEWFDEHNCPRRARRFDDAKPPDGMRLIRTIVLREGEDEEIEQSEEVTTGEPTDEGASAVSRPQRWSWYEEPRGADDEGSRSAAGAVLLHVHSADVEREARNIVERLPLEPGLRHAVVLAAKHHDHGKRRRVWQRSIGNPDPTQVFAKSGGAMRPLDVTSYRHELGSMLDAEQDGLLLELEPEERELALHLIAAHHGRARPHFPEEEMFDPEARGVDLDAEGIRMVQRFARLQRKYGRWGLAYLESLVRAADYAASARPSQIEKVRL